jgi:cytochrome bd-type quinol oxidase subunit 2
MLKYLVYALVAVSMGLSIATTVYWAQVYNTSREDGEDGSIDKRMEIETQNGYIRYWGMVINAVSAVVLPLSLVLHSPKLKMLMLSALVILFGGLLYASITFPNAIPDSLLKTAEDAKKALCVDYPNKKMCTLLTRKINAVKLERWASPVATAVCGILIFLKYRT